MLPSKGQYIHINPNFKNDVLQKLQQPFQISLPSTTHINPLFMNVHDPPKQAPTTIHMNPQFLNDKLLPKKEIGQGSVIPKMTSDTHQTLTEKELLKKSVPKVAQLNKIISKSRTRIIRESHSQSATSKTMPKKQLLVLTKRKLIRAPMLTAEQKCLTTLGNEIFRKKERQKTLYPLTSIVPILKRRQGAFVARYALRRSNSVLKKNVFPTSTTVERKLMNQMDKTKNSVNKQLRLININGILYKSTGKKLQRNIESTSSTNSKSLQCKTNPPKIVPSVNSRISNPTKNSIGRTLYVRGAKYVMDPRGFKLTRITQSNSPTVALKPKMSPSSSSSSSSSSSLISSLPKSLPRRIDIGGVTYIASGQSKNVFVRTSTHLILAHLNQAKQRSVQVLSRSLTKTNKPCLIFQRLGKCSALERNRCSKVHDKQRIIVCPKFLQGLCFNTDCLLSHTKTLQKMPVCRFFLQGSCVRTDCPYLHKKLRDDSEICDDFRRGFCALGEQCNKQHVFSIPKAKLKTASQDANELLKPSTSSNEAPTASDAAVYRYFNGETFVLGAIDNMAEKSEECLNEPSSDSENTKENEDEILENLDSTNSTNNSSTNLKRKQLGTQPAFIPLS